MSSPSAGRPSARHFFWPLVTHVLVLGIGITIGSRLAKRRYDSVRAIEREIWELNGRLRELNSYGADAELSADAIRRIELKTMEDGPPLLSPIENPWRDEHEKEAAPGSGEGKNR